MFIWMFIAAGKIIKVVDVMSDFQVGQPAHRNGQPEATYGPMDLWT